MPIGRRDACPHCDADLRCCLNCSFYDPLASNECREPNTERVLEKNRSNFCDHFEMRTNLRIGEENKTADAKNKLEELFKKSSTKKN